MGFPLSSFSFLHARGRCIVGYCWRGMREGGCAAGRRGSIPPLLLFFFFWSVNLDGVHAVVNHFDSDVSSAVVHLSWTDRGHDCLYRHSQCPLAGGSVFPSWFKMVSPQTDRDDCSTPALGDVQEFSFLIGLFVSSLSLQPSSCCSTWCSTVSWPGCSPWPCGWCCSLWTTTCRGTGTVFLIQVSVFPIQNRGAGVDLGSSRYRSWHYFRRESIHYSSSAAQRQRRDITLYITAAFCIDLFWSLFLWGGSESAAARRGFPASCFSCWHRLPPDCLLFLPSPMQAWWFVPVRWILKWTNPILRVTPCTSSNWSRSCRVRARLRSSNSSSFIPPIFD